MCWDGFVKHVVGLETLNMPHTKGNFVRYASLGVVEANSVTLVVHVNDQLGRYPITGGMAVSILPIAGCRQLPGRGRACQCPTRFVQARLKYKLPAGCRLIAWSMRRGTADT
jgi:hypothetical protein